MPVGAAGDEPFDVGDQPTSGMDTQTTGAVTPGATPGHPYIEGPTSIDVLSQLPRGKADITIRQGDTLPDAVLRLLDRYGSPVSLRSVQMIGAAPNIVFRVRRAYALGDIIGGYMTIIDPDRSEVVYSFVDGNTAEAGTFKGEVIVTFTDGKKLTFPAGSDLVIQIVGDI